MQVTINPDADGYTGRECPTCEKYFKIKFGTGPPGEIASIIAWLASEESGYSTGADFSVNGGLHMG